MATTKMARSNNLLPSYALPLLLMLFLLGVNSREEQKTYIIQMDHSYKPTSFETNELWHKTTLKSLSTPVDENMLLYTYNHVMHGFSASLTPSQLSEMEKSDAHVATYPESFGKLFTTHSPQFLGLNRNYGLLSASLSGEGVIIGVIDTGIWPESESFNDKGMPPVPRRWNGECENGTAFTSSLCNRKLIGARSFRKGAEAAGKWDPHDYDSPRDFFGHGTHTSSTAAGSHVQGVSHFGYAKGTARGIAPRAHLAMYKVLWADEGAASDVLAGMDQAIEDGVDIMSISLGFDQTPYFNDVIAIASLSAILRGVSVVCAAGNDGNSGSIHNGAPWITTVGAGTLDRTFSALLTLGNEVTFEGTSYFPESVYVTDRLLYYGSNSTDEALCKLNSLKQDDVKGKVVICDGGTDIYSQMEEIRRAGGYAGIFMADFIVVGSDEYFIPSVILTTELGTLVKAYATGVSKAVVKSLSFIHTNLGTKPAPQVAFFSSRGPDPITPTILKPDILAPGVDVIAAVAPNVPFTEIGKYDLVTDYALFSGTSMAAPHVAGVVALLKAVHPEWSPAAIRSAIMTTAYTLDNTGATLQDQWPGSNATPIDFGAGHINPNNAMNPGLVYDMGFQDYVNFLCTLGYNETQMKAIVRGDGWNCSQRSSDLNYPSFVAIFSAEDSSPKVMNFTREVTNVGDADSFFEATLDVSSAEMSMKVEPSSIQFNQKFEKSSFTLSVQLNSGASTIVYGYLKWTDQYGRMVSSPVVIMNI